MSWHFSQALVADYLQASSLDGELFAPLKSSHTPEAYCWRDRTTESLDLFQYGMMSNHSTDRTGEELLTWYRADFHAPISASSKHCGDAKDCEERAAACGGNTCESLTSASQDTFSGKTHQNSRLTDSTKSFIRFPSEGMYANGQLSELTIAVFPTYENDFGFSLPAPTARDWKDTPGMKTTRADGKTRLDRLPMILFDAVRSAGLNWKQMTNTDAQTVSVRGLDVTIRGRSYCPELPEWLMGWPIGWTDLKPLEMDRFQRWRFLHGERC